MNSAGRQAGIALLAVLWVISGLSIVAATVLTQTRTDIQLTRTHADLAKARAMAEAGVYRAVYELLRPRGTVQFGLPENMPRLEGRGSVVTIHIENEAGKIDVNTAPEALIRSMFAKAGASGVETSLLTGRFNRMNRLNDDTALPNTAPEFPSIEAFAAGLDLSQRVWETIAPWITVHNGQPGINPYVADEAVLSIVPGFDASLLTNPLRKGSPDRLQSRLMRPDHRYFTDRLSPVYTIAARATVGSVSTTVEAIIEMSSNHSRPYKILAWNETPRFRGG